MTAEEKALAAIEDLRSQVRTLERYKTNAQRAARAYEQDPLNIDDRPESWRKLDELLSAVHKVTK